MEDDNEIRAMFVRLKNGDDIIAQIVETGDDENYYITLISPLKVGYLPSENRGYLQVAFMPWVYPKICDFQQFTIAMSDILFISHVSDYTNDYYWDSIDGYLTPQSSKDDPVNEDTGMTEEEEAELYKNIMDHLSSKRTLH